MQNTKGRNGVIEVRRVPSSLFSNSNMLGLRSIDLWQSVYTPGAGKRHIAGTAAVGNLVRFLTVQYSISENHAADGI